MRGWAILMMAAMAPALAVAEPSAKPPVAYTIALPTAGATHEPRGWGAYATFRGQTLDLRSRDTGWADDPDMRRGDIEAGVGWRGQRASALVGFVQRDLGRPDWAAAVDPRRRGWLAHDTSDVVGFSVSLRSR